MFQFQANRKATLAQFLFFLVIIGGVSCIEQVKDSEHFHDLIYTHYDSSACIRLINHEGNVGCSTNRGGVGAPMKSLLSEHELTSFLKSPPDFYSGFVGVLNATLFNKDNVKKLLDTGKLDAILVTYPEYKPSYYSPAEKYPNKAWGLHPDSKYDWNPEGDGWSQDDIKIPMFVLNKKDTSEVIKAVKENDGGEWPQWAAELTSWMFANDDVHTCLRRDYCDPIGGKSIWSSVGLKSDEKKTILAITSIDSGAMFHDYALGATADISGVISLLGAADALRDDVFKSLKEEIAFMFFDAETWGYSGSRRFVHQHDDYIKNISAIIETRQVALFSDDETYYVHMEKGSDYGDATAIAKALQDAAAKEQSLTISTKVDPNAGGTIPPSSLMTFLAASPSTPGLVVTNHAGPYTDPYYHSMFDTEVPSNETLDSLCELSSTIARSLYALANHSNVEDSIYDNIQANCTLLKEMYHCLVHDFMCPLIKEYTAVARTGQRTHYSGLSGHTQLTSAFIANFLVEATGVHTTASCRKDSECEKDYSCSLQKCVKASTSYFSAVSPAFSYYSEWKVVQSDQPMWTESKWATLQLRVYKMSSGWTDKAVFGFGIFQVLLSLAVGWVLKKYIAQFLNEAPSQQTYVGDASHPSSGSSQS